MSFKVISVASTIGLLAACGGSGGGGADFGSLDGYLTELTQLQNDPTVGSFAPQTTVDGLRGSATYAGVINIGVAQPGGNNLNTRNYLGGMTMTVDFVDGPDSMTGTAGDFVLYQSTVATNDIGSSVDGSLAFTGTTTSLNESLGDGITGTMTGSIQGVDSSGTFDGNIMGINANGMSLFLDGPGLGGGVAILAD